MIVIFRMAVTRENIIRMSFSFTNSSDDDGDDDNDDDDDDDDNDDARKPSSV